MFKSFETIKTQLTELAPAINAFKSEAVQLRIVELIFASRYGESVDSPEDQTRIEPERRTRRRRKAPVAKTGNEAMKGPKRRPGASGPVVTLNELVEADFFAKHRTLNEIIDYCRNNKAKNFRPDQLSGPLARFVRDERLNRQKNNDGQYEYWK